MNELIWLFGLEFGFSRLNNIWFLGLVVISLSTKPCIVWDECFIVEARVRTLKNTRKLTRVLKTLSLEYRKMR